MKRIESAEQVVQDLGEKFSKSQQKGKDKYNPMEGKSRHLVTTGGIEYRVVDYGNQFEGPLLVTEEVDKGPVDMTLGSFLTRDQEAGEKAAWEESGEEMRRCGEGFNKDMGIAD